MGIAEREGTLERDAERIADAKCGAMGQLGRYFEAVPFLRQLVGRFPRLALLHWMLSASLLDVFNRAGATPQANKGSREAKDALEESVRHALEAAQLAPDRWYCASQACFLLCEKGDFASALQYGKRAFALAPTGGAKVEALQGIARVYRDNDLYADARGYLREALQIDDCNVGVIADIAHCFYMEGNQGEAIRMAKHGLMLDPRNEQCRRICSYCGCRD
jgi:tetratricopeptide (TPR) repeat protein